MQVHEKRCDLLGFTLHYVKLMIGNVLVNLGTNEKEIVKQTNIYMKRTSEGVVSMFNETSHSFFVWGSS